jgi:hypothetical protein
MPLVSASQAQRGELRTTARLLPLESQLISSSDQPKTVVIGPWIGAYRSPDDKT